MDSGGLFCLLIGVAIFGVLLWRIFSGSDETTSSSTSSQQAGAPGLFKLRVRSKLADPDDPKSHVFAVEVRGTIPIVRGVRLKFVTHAIDPTHGAPLLCPIPQLQESETLAFMQEVEVGFVPPGSALDQWTGIGLIAPQLLIPPYGGTTRLKAVVHLVDMDRKSGFHLGTPTSPGAILGTFSSPFSSTFAGKGYLEQREGEEKAMGLVVQIAICVAMADGHLDDAEGLAIKEWMTKTLRTGAPERRDDLKASLNSALRSAHAQATDDRLDLDALLGDLAAIDEPALNHQCLQLAYEVLAADGTADPSELAVTERIAGKLGVDQSDVSRMRDHAFASVSVMPAGGESPDQILGIRADWSDEQIARHLRDEFRKWNSRVTTLPPGTERDNAQRMLDLIAEARARRA